MAYKFQRGDAILSGSIKAEDGLVATDVDATTADFVVAALTAGDIPFSKLAIADAKILIGDNANGHAQEFALSGDVTMTAGGVVTIANNAVEASMLNSNVLSGSANGLNINADGLAVKLSGSASGLAIDAGGLTIDADPNSFLVDGNGLQLDTGVAGSALSLADGQLSVANLGNAQIAANAAIAHTKLAGITAASVLMGNASGVATATAISGDISLANNGAVTIADNAVSLAKMAGLSSGTFILGSAGNDPAAVSMSGDATMANNGAVSLAAAQTNITSILATDLVLGEDAQTAISFETVNQIDFKANNNVEMTITDSGVVIAGNLTVQGSTTTVDSTTINISSSFTFEGPADDHETILTCATPGADTTLSLPTLSAGSYFIPALADAATDASAAVTAAEFALLDGASADSSVAIADSDQMIINDGGVMKQTAMSDLKSYVAGASTLAVASKADGNALEEDKVNFFADLNANATVTLPASAAGLIGKSVYIKAKDLTSGATIIINTQAADQKIDGENSIVLESPYASVRLIYVATNDWRVF